ncbi:CPK2, partial [Symbiodinium microadriaticum]
AWSSVAFQAEGLAKELNHSDAASILRGLAWSGTLGRHPSVSTSLLTVLTAGEGLRSRKVVGLWVAMDRADMAMEQEARDYFRQHLLRALPPDLT